MTSQKPGWYPVKDDPGTLRYWDGTAYTQVAPKPPESNVGVLLIARGVALGILIAGAVIFVLAQLLGGIAAQDAFEDMTYQQDLAQLCDEAATGGALDLPDECY